MSAKGQGAGMLATCGALATTSPSVSSTATRANVAIIAVNGIAKRVTATQICARHVYARGSVAPLDIPHDLAHTTHQARQFLTAASLVAESLGRYDEEDEATA